MPVMKKKQNKGFTLAELLIVVAIIAVLVAISIPIFHAQLRKARLATNQANGRAAFSAAEAAYLENMEKYGTSASNSFTHGRAEDYDTVTYTYFPALGRGILNFHYKPGDNRWICDGNNKIYTNTDVSHWTVDTQVSDGMKLGDQVARIWTIHMNPENGEIKGYYCAFPKANETEYNNVLKDLANGDDSKYEQK
jgi:prepilin-type N-terminal cleavage/methylation domain-containing protein